MKPALSGKGHPYLLLFMLTLVGTVSLLGYQLWASRARIMEQAATDTANLAWIFEDHIDSTLRRADSHLSNLARDMPPEAMTQEAAPRFRAIWNKELASYMTKFPEVSNYNVFDSTGLSLYASNPALGAFSVADRPYFTALRDKPTQAYAYSDVIVSRASGHPTVSMARTLRDRNGRFLGIVTALLDFRFFQRVFDSVDTGPHGVIAMRRNEDYRLVMRSPHVPAEINKSISTAISRRIAAGEKIGTERLTSPIDGLTRTFSFRVLKNYPFNINVSRADRDVLAPWWRQSTYSVMALVLLLSIFGLLLRRTWRSELQHLTARQQLEQQEASLREATRLAEAANLAKSTFLASMSHELRTPLNAVLGYAQLLRTDEQASQEIRDDATEIEKAGQHLLALVNDVIDLARIESGKLELSVEDVELDEVLSDCLSLIRPRAQERGIRIDAPATAAVLHVDRLRLRQILLNLLSNAVKYNREMGSISIRGMAPSPGRYRVAVTDTGPGLSQQQMKDLFNSFNRLGAENSSTEGTGIGLVITKSLVELMGGTIGASSVRGAGCTFWVELPLAAPAA